MTDLGIYTKLMTIVSYTADELNRSAGDIDQMWLLAFRGMTMMNFSFAGQTQTVRLPVLPNKTVMFPPALLSWSKIGLLDENGQINTLKVNNALTTFRDNNPNRIQNLSSPNINSSVGELALVPYYTNYYYNGGCYQLYGLGNGVITYGDCKVDELNRVIILDPNFKYDSILIEGVMSPMKDYDYEVPTCLTEAIIAFIKWKLKLGSRDEFYAAAVEGRRSLPKKKVILQTLNQVLRESDGFKLRS